MTKFMTISALIFASRTLKSLYMFGITTFVTSVFTLKNLTGIKFLVSLEYPMFLDLNLLFLNCFLLALFGGISALWCLNKFTWVACGSLDIFLMCLAVDLDDYNLLEKCLTLVAGKFFRINVGIINCFTENSSSLRKKQNMSVCKIFAVSAGYFARLNCAWTALCHSSTLISPCLKLVQRSNLALTSMVWGLQNSSNVFNIISKHKSSGGKYQDTNWSIPKSPDQATTFLHFLAFDNIASSQSSIFSHLIFHFRNLWYKLSFTFQSIFGPSMYGIYICCIACIWLVEGWNCGICITISSSELDSCDKWESSCNSFSLVLFTWLDFLAAVGNLRVWFQHLQNSLSKI